MATAVWAAVMGAALRSRFYAGAAGSTGAAPGSER
jgi:hypothetical protein